MTASWSFRPSRRVFYNAHKSGVKISTFIPILSLDSKSWTLDQAKRVWRINAAAIEYFARRPHVFDYRTEEGQAYFFAICHYFMTHPLINEDAPNPPDAAERNRRKKELDALALKFHM